MLTQKGIVEKRLHETIMPDSKIQAIYEEFPQVKKLDLNSSCFYVSRIDSSFGDYELRDPHLSYDQEVLYLLDKNGDMLSTEVWGKKFFFFGSTVLKKKEIGLIRKEIHNFSMREKFGELGDAIDRVHLIVSYYRYVHTVIIYKLPKNTSLKDILRKGVLLEKKKLQKELLAIS